MRKILIVFCLSFSFIPLKENTNNKILIEDFSITEKEEQVEISFLNKIEVPFSLFTININKNFKESYKVDLGFNKILINQDYFLDVNMFNIEWTIYTGFSYNFEFKYIRPHKTYFSNEDRYMISLIEGLNAPFITLKEKRWFEFRKNKDYIHIDNNQIALYKLGFFIFNDVAIKNMYLKISSFFISYPYSIDEEGFYHIPLIVGNDKKLHYKDKLSNNEKNDVYFSSSSSLNDKIIFKKAISEESFKIYLCILETDVIPSTIYYELDIKNDYVIAYPSDIFKFIYE